MVGAVKEKETRSRAGLLALFPFSSIKGEI